MPWVKTNSRAGGMGAVSKYIRRNAMRGILGDSFINHAIRNTIDCNNRVARDWG